MFFLILMYNLKLITSSYRNFLWFYKNIIYERFNCNAKCRPDIEEGEKLIRRNNNPPKCADQSLFLNFAMHSVRMEACDCPPTHTPPKEWQCESRESSPESSDHPIQGSTSYEQSGTSNQEEQSNQQCTYNELKQADCFWGKKKNRKNKDQGAGKKVSQVKEKSRYSVQESEKFRRPSNDGFLRVLFWQFHNFRMLLGSDLLIFSNEKYVAVSLHLWDVSRQVNLNQLPHSYILANMCNCHL